MILTPYVFMAGNARTLICVVSGWQVCRYLSLKLMMMMMMMMMTGRCENRRTPDVQVECASHSLRTTNRP